MRNGFSPLVDEGQNYFFIQKTKRLPVLNPLSHYQNNENSISVSFHFCYPSPTSPNSKPGWLAPIKQKLEFFSLLSPFGRRNAMQQEKMEYSNTPTFP